MTDENGDGRRAQQTGTKAEAESKLKAEYEAEMEKLEKQISASKGKVIGDLVSRVTRV